MTAPIASVSVLGAGAWGTALALTAARAGRKVSLYAREPELRAALRTKRENDLYLPGIVLPAEIAILETPEEAARADMVLAVVPTQHLRAAIAALAPRLSAGQPVVICAKGLERGSDRLLTEAVAEAAPRAEIAVLSGPSFAEDVAAGLPTAITLAADDAATAEALAQALARPHFRPYVSTDMIGAEIGGAVKNILAIACGIVDGAGLGLNARAALISRGFAEMSRFGLARGAKPETLAGLAGLGDLVLTCTSANSRNFALGQGLGRGETAAALMADRRTVAEGAFSAPVIAAAARVDGIEMPITDAVARIVAGEIRADEAIQLLLSRPLRPEGR